MDSTSPPPDSPGKVRQYYVERRDRFANDAKRLGQKSARLTNVRMAQFVVMVGAGGAWLWWLNREGPLWVVAVAALLGFLFTVAFHRRLRRRLKQLEAMCDLNRQSLDRLDRNWKEVPRAAAPGDANPPEVASDLDLLGHASVFHLASPLNSPPGRETLANWLLRPAGAEEIKSRQAAIAELSPQLDFRQRFSLQGADLAKHAPNVRRFLSWAEDRPWLSERKVIVWASRLLPICMFALGIANVQGSFGDERLALAGHLAMILLFVGGILFSMAMRARLHATLAEVTLGSDSFAKYAGLLKLIDDAKFAYPKLSAIQQQCMAEGHTAHEQMDRLDTLVGLANLRYSEMQHFLLQSLFLWDFHVLVLIERWQRDVGQHARAWLEALGQFEALCGLANLHHDHPHWIFPFIEQESSPRLIAKGLGHPLLSSQQAVTADVEVGPAGTFLLVTGSNMSGKSTLLRAIGVNVTLAQAGGPVFAKKMSLSPVQLGTSFRVRDSLEAGVSLFMAELRRLKQVVDMADAPASDDNRPLLFLFDEILLGTNIMERQIAVQKVLGHLMDRRAIGAIATHDLTIADAPGLADACRPVHFTEQFHEDENGPQMSFDYVLRPGIAPTTNALKLLRIVGLDQ